MPKITKRVVDAIRPSADGRDVFVWDSEIKGFGVRMKPSGSASYFIQYRNAEGRTRRYRIGKITTLTPDEARVAARGELAEVDKGGDPSAKRNRARKAITVSELCDWYLRDAKGRIKPSTLALDHSRVACHVKPLIGNLTVTSLTRADIERLQSDIASGKSAKREKRKGRGQQAAGGRGVAARTVGMLGTMLEFAKRRGVVTENVAREVKRFPDNKRHRFLNRDESERLGQALKDHRDGSAVALDAVRLLLLTGCRRTEALSLEWAEVDLAAQCLRFKDTKSGAQLRIIGSEAVALLNTQPRTADNEYVFPAARGEGHFVGLPRVFGRLCAQAQLEDVSLHTLRHTFAAVAAELGYSELTIAGLLGHRVPGITARYAHMPDRALVSAANQVAGHIAALLDGGDLEAHDKLVPMRAARR